MTSFLPALPRRDCLKSFAETRDFVTSILQKLRLPIFFGKLWLATPFALESH